MDQEIISLIQRVQQGDEVAFSELYEKYRYCVYVKAYQMTQNDADAKDIVQEVFYQVHRFIHTLEDPRKFYSWLMVITTSRTKNLFRKHTHDAIYMDNIQDLNMSEERIEANPHQFVENHSEQAVVQMLLSRLPAMYMEVLSLMYFQGMKQQEIADVLQIPLGTVKNRITRARREFKKIVVAYEEAEGRKVSFHLDGLLPVSLLSLVSLKAFCMDQLIHFKQIVVQNVALSGCALSFTVLAVSGSVFLYEDVTQAASAQNKQIIAHSDREKQENKSIEEAIVLPKNAFKQIAYKEQVIADSQEAYYILLEFAPDEAAMKEKTKEEFQEIRGVYEQFKEANSNFYQMLCQSGWSTQLELYLYSDI